MVTVQHKCKVSKRSGCRYLTTYLHDASNSTRTILSDNNFQSGHRLDSRESGVMPSIHGRMAVGSLSERPPFLAPPCSWTCVVSACPCSCAV